MDRMIPLYHATATTPGGSVSASGRTLDEVRARLARRLAPGVRYTARVCGPDGRVGVVDVRG